jgi:hypothetical protein
MCSPRRFARFDYWIPWPNDKTAKLRCTTTFDLAELYRAYVLATPLQQPKTKIEMIHAETRDNSGFPAASAEVCAIEQSGHFQPKTNSPVRDRAPKSRKDESRFTFMNLC